MQSTGGEIRMGDWFLNEIPLYSCFKLLYRLLRLPPNDLIIVLVQDPVECRRFNMQWLTYLFNNFPFCPVINCFAGKLCLCRKFYTKMPEDILYAYIQS